MFEFIEHFSVVHTILDGEHSGCITHSKHLFAGELIVHVSGKSGKEGNVIYVRLSIENRLVIVRYAPAHRDVEREEFGKLTRRLLGIGVAPGPEGDKEVVCLVEGEITVHHSRYTYRGKLGQGLTKSGAVILA